MLQEDGSLHGPVPGGAATVRTQTQGIELLQGMSESIFAAVAPDMVDLGWSIFPQETSGDRRLPGRVHGKVIRWREDHDLSNRRPSKEFLRDCVLQCASLNVACVFGPASGNTFAIDIDVMNAPMAGEIVAIAEEILGPTPFMRVGRAPKIALIYRHAPDDTVPSTSRHFAEVEPDGTVLRSGDGLEILGATKLITFHGRHHKTGNYFSWIGTATPLLDGPEIAPLVTSDRVATFLEAVDARFRFHRGSAFHASAVTLSWDEETWGKVPKLALVAAGSPWAVDEEGRIFDGREAFLTTLTYHMTSGFKGNLDEVRNSGREALDAVKKQITAGVVGNFITSARMEARGRWSEGELAREAFSKVSRLADKYLRGENPLHSRAVAQASMGPILEMPPPADDAGEEGIAAGDPELSFLRPAAERLRTGHDALRGTIEPAPQDGADLSIPADRAPIAEMVQAGLAEAFSSFLDDVYGDPVGQDPNHNRRARLHILKAPTGGGKTSQCIRTLAADIRTKQDYCYSDPKKGARKERAPWVMLLPTYANIDELRLRAAVLNLDGNLPDAELRAAALEKNLMAEEDLEAKLADLRRDALDCGLETMVYSGKLRAGCDMKEKVQLAMDAGIGTAAFCRATVRKKDPGAKKDDPGEMVEVVCPLHDSCKAIAQRADIAKADVVFMPHSFLSLSIPEELETVRGVIADERVHHLFLHTATFAATSLSTPRKPPRLTAAEKARDIRPDDLLAERDMAAQIALEAMRGGPDTDEEHRCPARALYDWRPDGTAEDAAPPGMALVRSALKVCTSAIQRDGNLSPDTPIDEVRSLCSRPTGRDIREEREFWSIVLERMQALQHDALVRTAIRTAEEQLEGFQGQWDPVRRERLEKRLAIVRTIKLRAQGAWDYRIQYLIDPAVNGSAQELVRISWRTRPNWPGTPVLLLDASAAPPIIAKIWGLPERDIVVHDVVQDTGRALNVKIVGIVNQTFSNSSIAASADAMDDARLAAATNLANVRKAISTVSALYGHGRVVAGTSIVLRELINGGWACPDNVDWCHFGAMRGLDGFKFHSAAISIGRMEPPTRTIDGLVAALTYDDGDPEAPFDLKGEGTDAEGRPLRQPLGDQRLRLRSGHVAVLKVPMFQGRWARLVQRQYREEELLQFVGRLRPVYREGPAPVWFALSSVIPEELVVDDLIHVSDLLRSTHMLWDAVRRTGGIAEPEVLAASCPDIYRGDTAAARIAAARRDMVKAGFPPEGGPPDKREAAGFSSYLWKDRKGQERIAFVRASISDGPELLCTALQGRIGEETPVRVWSPDAGIGARARARDPDAVEVRIGPAGLRPAREAALLDRVGESIMSGTRGPVREWKEKVYYPYGHDKFLTLPEYAAKQALDGFWQARAGAADDRLMPLITEPGASEGGVGEEAPLYETMGSSVADDDRLAA